MNTANTKPDKIAPARNAANEATPNKIPTPIGTVIEIILGMINSRREPFVAMSIVLLKSAGSSPVRILGFSSNCLRISSTIFAAFL